MSSEIYFPVQHVCGDLYEQKIEIEKERTAIIRAIVPPRKKKKIEHVSHPYLDFNTTHSRYNPTKSWINYEIHN